MGCTAKRQQCSQRGAGVLREHCEALCHHPNDSTPPYTFNKENLNIGIKNIQRNYQKNVEFFYLI